MGDARVALPRDSCRFAAARPGLASAMRRSHADYLCKLVGSTGMATSKQKAAARRNIKKAANAARRNKTISKLPKKTRTALGKQGAKMAKRKRRRK